ncbi:MAG: glycosyltransferase family 39 protein [Bacteroidetes bacterium]|nr:glycosyltransferase family 39 protein [Bacteroidota bacterium]
MAHPWSEPVLLNDEYNHAFMGEYILNNGDFNYNVYTEVYSSFRAPGYPLFIALIYFILGKTLWLIPFVQVILDTGTVIIIYFISLELFKSKKISLIAALLYSINLPSVFYAQFVIPDLFFVFLFSLSILLFIRAVKSNSLLGYIIAALLLGLSVNIKPIVLYFPVVIFIIVLFTKNKPVKKLIFFSAFLITFLLLLLPWQLRNLNTFGHFKFTSQSGYSVYNYNIAIAEADLYDKPIQEIKNEHLRKVETISNPFDKSAVYDKLAIDFLLEHPFVYAKHHIFGMIKMFLSTSKGFLLKLFNIEFDNDFRKNPKSIYYRVIQNIYSPEHLFLTPILISINILIYIFSLFGIYKMWRANYMELLFLIIIIAYFVNITGVIGGLQYKLPVIPFYMILSAVGIIEFYQILLEKYWERKTINNSIT